MQRTIDETRSRVRTWGETIRADSIMYSQLARFVAKQDDILDLIRAAPPGQLEMNMLLAAVQYLLLADPSRTLTGWYPSLGGTSSDDGLEDAFAAFVAEHKEHIHQLITTRRVQTNEVARCVFLLPAYNIVQQWTGRTIALAEIGTSAGLNQNLDRYGYEYHSDSSSVLLRGDASVQLSTDCGPAVPASADRIPDVAWRTGFDLHPIDVTDDDQARWLRALVWPDQVERHTRLEAAIRVAHEHPPVVSPGDAFEVVPELVEAAPKECALIVQHSFVLNQFSNADRERFYELLDEQAAIRPIYRVAAEWTTRIRETVLTITQHGRNRDTIELGGVHHHGAWIRITDPA